MNVMIVYIVAAIALFIISVLYYKRIVEPAKMMEERILLMDFHEQKFINDTKSATFQYYKEKWGKLAGLPWFGVILAVMMPPYFLPYPADVMVMILGTFMIAFGAMFQIQRSAQQEIAEASNRPFGNSFVFWPEHGNQDHMFRRMELQQEIELDESQVSTITDQMMDTIQTMDYFQKHKDEIDIDELREKIHTRMKENHYYRYKVSGKYHILLITPHTAEQLECRETTSIIDRTLAVDVNLMPMWLVYGGNTERIFTTVDENGKKVYTARRMGIFLDLYDIVRRNKELITGGFTAPDAMTALVGEFVHLYDQRQHTSTEMTKTTRQMEKARWETEKDEFDAEAKSAKMIGAMENIVDIMTSILEPKERSKMDYGAIVATAIIFLLIGIFLF